MDAGLLHLLHQALFGAIAAAGFGVLFNIGPKTLVWAMAAGALALGVRTLGLQAGWSLEAASFAAAIAASCAVRFVRIWLGAASNAVALAGCIPMVPGAFMSQAILGLFAVTAPHPENEVATIVLAMEYMLRVIFTLGAIGAGLAIPTHLLRNKDF
jgi:uncharacterized membrane protein YjjB (DUF3815 family)